MKPEKLLLPLAWIVLLLAASLLRFKTVLSGDSLYLENLATDLFRAGGHWHDWVFTAAPGFVPDMLLYFLAYPVFPSVFERIFAVSFAQALLLAGTCLWFARQIHPQLSRRAGAAIVLGVALATLAAARSSMWLYYCSTNNHLAAPLFGLAAIVAALRYAEAPTRRRALALPLAIAIGAVSTNLLTLNVTVPALAVLGVLWLRAGKAGGSFVGRRRLAALAGQVVLGAVLAIVLEKLLVRYPAGDGRIHASSETAGQSLTLFLHATVTAFDPHNRWTFALALLLLASLLFLGWRLLANLTVAQSGVQVAFDSAPRIAATSALLAVAWPVNLLGTVLTGHFADPFAYRYFIFPLVLSALLAIVLLDRRAARWPWYAVLACGAVCVIAGSLAMRREAQRPPRFHPIADCLRDLQQDLQPGGQPLGAGISEFWLGPQVAAFTGPSMPIFTTLNDLTPFHWVSTIGPLLRPENYPAYRFHFALLNPPRQTEAFNYTRDTIGKVLPPPTHVYACPGDTEVWYYAGMELDSAVRAAGARYIQEKHIHR